MTARSVSARRRTGIPPLYVRGRNHLLGLLAPKDSGRVLRSMKKVSLKSGQTLHEPGKKITDVYFPVDAVVSLVIRMNDGEAAEVATIGKEGFVGVSLLLGGDHSTTHVFTQIPGEALRMPVAPFQRQIGPGGAFNGILRRYAQAYLTQVAQTAACNRLHPVEERLCRWILMTHDRTGLDNLPLTQEFLAVMLGVHRPTVSMTAGILQKAGLIRYRRGNVQVLDRAGLEASCCECYQVVQFELERLLLL